MCSIFDTNIKWWLNIYLQEAKAKAAQKGPLVSGGIKKSGKK